MSFKFFRMVIFGIFCDYICTVHGFCHLLDTSLDAPPPGLQVCAQTPSCLEGKTPLYQEIKR